MRKSSWLILFLLCSFSLLAKSVPLDEFIRTVRLGSRESSFAKLDGTLQHQRRGAERLTMPIYFGVIIRPDRTSGQIILNQVNNCLVSQAHRLGGTSPAASGASTTVANDATLALFDRVGLRPSDLTLGFVFYQVIGEGEPQTLSGVVPCRVIDFRSPDQKEIIRAYISAEYCFVIKAEFFHAGEAEPYRTLECGGFTKKNDLYYVQRITVEGPGWRTRIDFDQADVGSFSPADPPAGVIRQVKEEKKK